jgi:hypothetical protein
MAYIRAILGLSELKGALHYSSYRGTKAFMALTALSTARAVLAASPQAPRLIVYVDGLPKSRLRWFGSELRRLSVRPEKVVGVRRDESDALIRLADACCGFVRLALLGMVPEAAALLEQGRIRGYFREV